MPTVNLGRVGFVNKGDFVEASSYKLNDIVVSDKSVYACIQTVPGSSGILLSNDSYWQKWLDGAEIAAVNLSRADKYLAAQNVANMVYTNGDLTKIQYKNATNIDYELFSYSGGNLSGIAHYVGGILKGNSVLLYTGGDLLSVIFREV